MRLDPGDTVVVPEDVEQIAWLKTVKDVASILGQFALMGGVIFAALKKAVAGGKCVCGQ